MRKGTNTVVVDIYNKTTWIVDKNNMDSDRIKKTSHGPDYRKHILYMMLQCEYGLTYCGKSWCGWEQGATILTTIEKLECPGPDMDSILNSMMQILPKFWIFEPFCAFFANFKSLPKILL
jgi:hypothetical protein